MGGFGLCTSCMNNFGYIGGEATRSAGVTAALVIRQVVAAAIAADNANEMVKTLQKNGKITEDERDRGLEEVQKATDSHIAKIDSELKNKEAEVMAV